MPLPLNDSPVKPAEDKDTSTEVVPAQRLQYLELLATLDIPLVMEGSPAEAFLVR